MKYNRRYTVLVSLIVALGGFLLGFDSAVISGAVPFIDDFFMMGEWQLGFAVSCLILGAMLGNAVAGKIFDVPSFGFKTEKPFLSGFYAAGDRPARSARSALDWFRGLSRF